ncbi:unnamed protein product, partial [Allacma fusca]
MALHLLYTFVLALGVTIDALVIIKGEDVTIAIFNFTLQSEDNHCSTASGIERTKRKKINLLKKYSLTELFAVFLPHASVILMFVFMTLVSIFCTKLHLYDLLPRTLKNPVVFGIFFIHENIIAQSTGAGYVLAFENILLFLENVNRMLNSKIEALRKQAQPADFIVRTAIRCRHVELFVGLFNIGYASTIFLIKEAYLGLSIASWFIAITSSSDEPSLSIFFIVLANYVSFMFAAFFGNAFSIPESIKSLKNELIRCFK